MLENLIDLIYTIVSLDRKMFKPFEYLAISVTVNCCILTYCISLRIQKRLSSKCSCDKCHIAILVCHVYESKANILAKILTEQVFLWIIVILSFAALCGSDVIRHPFSGKINSSFNDYVGILMAINIGRYIYYIAQNVFLYSHIDSSKFRTDVMHHVVTVVCYSVFLCYRQNILLALIGMLMETNSTLIDVSKILKEIGKNASKIYWNLSLANCAITVCFRGIIPVAFLVIAMFHETPFVMHYAVLTTFFLSIIFFSVINVWLTLATVQRLVKSFCKKGNDIEQADSDIHRACQSHGNQGFTRNNLGYLRRYDNKNLCTIDDEKLNTNRKDTKEHLTNLQFFQQSGIMNMTEPSESGYISSNPPTARVQHAIPTEEISHLRDSNSTNTSGDNLMVEMQELTGRNDLQL